MCNSKCCLDYNYIHFKALDGPYCPTLYIVLVVKSLLLLSADNLKSKANSLDPDQTRQTIVPELDINSLTLIGVLKKLI